MNVSPLKCGDERRRDRVRESELLGLDYVEVGSDQKTLTVVFLGRMPENLEVENLVIFGGERITDLKVTGFTTQPSDDPEKDDLITVTVDQPGDFSRYRLFVRALDKHGRPTDDAMPGFDPRYACVEFSFKAACPSDLDCKPACGCAPVARTEPDINYLAKDYESFRQLLFDRLAVIMPGWQERHVPDLGVTLVELLAYVGDQLSYYQDAVATEAYLSTARQRISVRRHARLVDYFMHEGCNARAWVILQPAVDFSFVPADVAFVTSLEDNTPFVGRSIIEADELRKLRSDAYQIFEPLVARPSARFQARVAQNEIKLYTWGDRLCCLAAGATAATLEDGWLAPVTPPPGDEETPPGDDPAAAANTPGARTRARARATATTPPAPERKLGLKVGDVVIFEEVKGPRTGNPADADPAHRWAVRLTRVKPVADPLIKTSDGRPTPLLEIEWSAADALPFALTLSTRLAAPDCRFVEGVAVVRGNVILVDQGGTQPPEDLGPVEKVDETGCCACEGSVVELTAVAGKYRPRLQRRPLTFRNLGGLDRPASRTLAQDPRSALPAIALEAIPPLPDGTGPLFPANALTNATALLHSLKIRTSAATQALFSRLSSPFKVAFDDWDGVAEPDPALLEKLMSELRALLAGWTPQRDLLASDPDDRRFVVEMDDDGEANLRFGDGAAGFRPEAGADFVATYRVGNGVIGNVGADRITKILFRRGAPDGLALQLRNPLPATGGTDPEPVSEVKLIAPGAFRQVLQRAITPGDYTTLASRNERLQGAATELRWTGSWYEAQVSVDPHDEESADAVLLDGVEAELCAFRRVGHDLAVRAARYVPLALTLKICVQPHFLRGHVEAALRETFSNRDLAGGRRGFFHPENLTFGAGVSLSRIVAAAQAVAGVREVEVTQFQRLYDPEAGEIASGLLPLGPNEIARLDNDPNYPEHGSLTLNLRGGR